MSFLSDAFPDEYKKQFAERSLTIGTVLRMFVEDTNPPKHKFFIVIGFTEEQVGLGVVYINSVINPNRFSTKELQELNLPLIADERKLVDRDCWIDCSKIFEKATDVIYEKIEKNPESVRGELSPDELKQVQIKLMSARTISPKTKKRFGYM